MTMIKYNCRTAVLTQKYLRCINMFDQKDFGIKIRIYRKILGLTQEELAYKIGVSGQAISKWESGDCLPDVPNLRELSRIFDISLNILLETDVEHDIDLTVRKIEQLANEFVWAKFFEYKSNDRLAHIEMGDDLWKMWKAVYFAEIGNGQLSEIEKVKVQTG